MRGAECASRFVPQQGIVLKVANGIRQVGDVGGVGRHVIVGGFELGAINGVSAASSQVASGNIGDLAGSFGAVFGAECCAIPEQGIFFQGINVRVQSSDTASVCSYIGGISRNIRSVSGDIGSVIGDIGSVGCNIRGVSGDIGCVGGHIVFGFFQLGTVNRIFTGV
ncbi:hypothetical protein ExPUPEC61_02194 [Escherichia coli]|nr:hypothetical protein ExPUPEC61_02194 [Escherichia coli]